MATNWREGQRCQRCRKSWDGIDALCNECQQLEVMKKFQSGMYSRESPSNIPGGGTRLDPQDYIVPALGLLFAMVIINYILNGIPLKILTGMIYLLGVVFSTAFSVFF